MEETQAYTELSAIKKATLTGRGLVSNETLGAAKEPPEYMRELDQLTKTLTLLGELQDRLHHKVTPVRSELLSKAEPVAEPTSSTSEAPLVTALKQLNYQATRILQNLSDTYDQIDL